MPANKAVRRTDRRLISPDSEIESLSMVCRILSPSFTVRKVLSKPRLLISLKSLLGNYKRAFSWREVVSRTLDALAFGRNATFPITRLFANFTAGLNLSLTNRTVKTSRRVRFGPEIFILFHFSIARLLPIFCATAFRSQKYELGEPQSKRIPVSLFIANCVLIRPYSRRSRANWRHRTKNFSRLKVFPLRFRLNK